jgi:HEAT repeat protein
VDELLPLATADPDPTVRAQAIRAIADVADPILVHDALDAGRGDQELAARLARLAHTDPDGRVQLEVLIALRRLKWSGAPQWLAAMNPRQEPAWEHAAMQLLRGCDNWPAVLSLLDQDGDPGSPHTLRPLVLRSLAEQAVPAVVDGLIQRLAHESNADERRKLADLLTRVHRRSGPWTSADRTAGDRQRLAARG